MRTIHPCRIVAPASERKPCVGVLWRSHLRRHDSDDGVTLIVQIDRATNRTGIAVECALPESIAEHHDRWSADFVFLLTKRPADFRRQADDVEKIPRYRSARHSFSFATRDAAKVSRFLVGAGEMFENLVVILPIEIIRQRNRVILAGSGRFVQDHDPVRVWIRQRPKQNGVDDAEDGGVRPDAESECNNSNCGERRILDHLPKSKTKIVHRICYSVRNATMGSTRVARRAGTQHATRATTSSENTAVATAPGSRVATL